MNDETPETQKERRKEKEKEKEEKNPSIRTKGQHQRHR